MDPVRNPFSPGAGTAPPELAGRDEILASAEVALRRTMEGRAAKSQLLLGLRGVGKTVLLNAIARMAQDLGYAVVLLEAPEDLRLAELLVPPLRRELFRLDKAAGAAEAVRKAMGVLRAFASVFKVSAGDIEFGVEAAPGTADSGDLNFDLPELFGAVAEAAKAAKKPFALFLDEIQYLSEQDLRALIVALHAAAQQRLPIILFGAGLPQLAALAGDAKSYAERLFDYPAVGPLAPEAARAAIERPIHDEGADITSDAVDALVDVTEGYPYFLQAWGSAAWNTAAASPINAEDAARATVLARAELDNGFFRVRWDRLTDAERQYLRRMASLGAGPYRSGDIAKAMGKQVSQVSTLRDGLIHKGMIYSPQHGETAFTVPLFDDYLRRTAPVPPTAPRAASSGASPRALPKPRKRSD